MSVEADKALIADATKRIDAAMADQYPIGCHVRFTWMREQKIGAKVIGGVRAGALQVQLTENALVGEKRKDDKMVIPTEWIVEKLS